jgi:putative two-component system protein, hydrogenase maturation factor HypX/HoxX
MATAVEEIAAMKDLDVLVFVGSKRNWSNGIHLNVIEHSAKPEEEAWNNIVAINKIVKRIYKISDKITISAMQTNAGAGGVYLALATDYCFGKEGIVLNPHYKNMGLYGSELHTATAAAKFGNSILNYMKDSAKPLLMKEALSLQAVDALEQEGPFLESVMRFAE